MKQYLALFAPGHGLGGRQISLYFTYPPPPTQNIGSAPANFFSSLALFLQRNKQFKKYWKKTRKRAENSNGVSDMQKLNVRLNKACTNIWVKVTIINRQINYLGVDDVHKVYGGGSSIQAIWQLSEVPWQWRWRVNKGSWIVVVLCGYLTPLFEPKMWTVSYLVYSSTEAGRILLPVL